MFRRSSAVEQLTVNQLVVGSIPTAGATKLSGWQEKSPQRHALSSLCGLFHFCGLDFLGYNLVYKLGYISNH